MMRLVYCKDCGNPIAKIAPGSYVEIKCKTCGAKTTIELKAVDLIARSRRLY